MSTKLATVHVGGLWMSLRHARGGYTLVFGILSDPIAVSITHLGENRAKAIDIFCRKVECHRLLCGEIVSEGI